MQSTIQKLRQTSIVLDKTGILSENLKTLTNSKYATVQYFLLKLRTQKFKKALVSTHSLFTLLLITPDINKTKTILQTIL